MSFLKRTKTTKKTAKKAKAKQDVELKKHLNLARKMVKTLGVNPIIPSQAISAAKAAVEKADSVTVEIPNKGFLVICLDGYDLHSIARLDDKNADNYDSESVGTFKTLITDDRRISSVTLHSDREDGFIVMLPTHKTLESLLTIGAIADVQDKKMFTWALLPSDLTENTPIDQQEVIEVKADKISLSDLLDASNAKIKPVATVNGDVIEVTLPKSFTDNHDEKAVIKPLSETTTHEVEADVPADANSKDDVVVDDEKTKNEFEDDDSENLFGDIDLNKTDNSVLDDSTTNQPDLLNNEDDDSDVFNENDTKSDINNNNDNHMNDVDKPDHSKIIDTANIQYDENGVAQNGVYKGLTSDEVSRYQIDNGFTQAPTQAEIDEIIAKRNDGKKVESISEKSENTDDTQNKDVVIKRLANYTGLDTPDLQFHVDEHAIENITDASEPYQFEFKEPVDENDTLTKSLNARKQNMNDEMREQFDKDVKALNDAFNNDLHTLFSTSQKRYSLSNMNGYGKRKQTIEDRYSKKRTQAENQIAKKQKELVDKFERDAQAVGDVARKKAIAQFHKDNDDLLDKQKRQIRDNELHQINYDQARDMNAMYAERQEEGDIFINQRFADLVKVYTNRWHAMQEDQKQTFNDNRQLLDDFVHDKFDEFARQKENIADIKRHDNKVNELKQEISNIQRNADQQVRDAENDAQVKISQIKNDVERQLQAKNAELKAKDAANDDALAKQKELFDDEKQTLQVRITDLNKQLQQADDRKDNAVKEQQLSDQKIIKHWEETVKSLESNNESVRSTNDELRKQLDDVNRKNKHRMLGASVGSAIAGALVTGVIALFGMTMTTHNNNNTNNQQAQQPVYVMPAPEQNNNKATSSSEAQSSSQASSSSNSEQASSVQSSEQQK